MGFENISIRGLEDEATPLAPDTKVYKKETLDHLKERFPNKVDEIFKVTAEELGELKGFMEANEKEKAEELIRKNLIEDDSDGDEDSEVNEKGKEESYNLDTITIGTKSEQMKDIKIGITSNIIDKLKPYEEVYKFTDAQKTNIVIGITAKILDNGALVNAFSGLGDGLNEFVGKAKKLDIVGALDVGQGEIDKLSKLQNIIDNNIGDLMVVLENNKGNPAKLKGLLSNPEKISTLDKNLPIDEKIALPAEMTDFLVKLNKEIIGIDEKISAFENMQSGFVNFLSNSPEIIQKATKGLLGFLLKIPVIGGMLASLLGYDSPEKALEGFGEEIKYAKATNNLISHGKDKEKVESENSLKIDILKDKDLSDVKYKKLKPLFETCKKEGIDYTTKDFWNKLINKVEIKEDSTDSDKKLFKLHQIYESGEIVTDDFENKKPKESFYEKLNKIKTPEEVKNEPSSDDQLSKDKLEAKQDEIKRKIEPSVNLEALGDTIFDHDLNDLKKDISLATLLSDDYKTKIQDQVGEGSDYENIESYVKDVRERAQKLGKDAIVELLKPKTASEITFGDLINPESKAYKELFGEELAELVSIKAEIEKQEALDKDAAVMKNEKAAIESAINHLDDGEFTKINYGIDPNKTSIDFDSEKQKININNKIYDVNMKFGYNLKSFVKNSNDITLQADILGAGKIDEPIDISAFVDSIYNLKTSGNVDLINKKGEKKGEITEKV